MKKMGVREFTVVIIAILIIVSALVMIFGKDVFYTPSEKPGGFVIRDIDLKPVKVTTSTAVFSVGVYLDHYGGNSSNSSLIIKVLDTDTGLLMQEVSMLIPEVEGEKTIEVNNNISVKREGGYEIKVLVFDRDRMVESGSVVINGLEALTPEKREVGVKIRDADFIIRDVMDGKANVEIGVYVENIMDSVSPALRMMVKAVQAESNIVADSTWIDVGSINPESLVIKKATVSVPESYNYMIEITLWNGDVVVEKFTKVLALAPSEVIPEESKVKPVNLEVTKFIRPTPAPVPAREAQETYSTGIGGFGNAPGYASPKTPGFTAISVAGVILLMMLFRRRYNG